MSQHTIADSLVYARRNLEHIRQVPEKLTNVTIPASLSSIGGMWASISARRLPGKIATRGAVGPPAGAAGPVEGEELLAEAR